MGPFGGRLIPTVIDQRANDEPDRVFASFAIDYDFSSYRDITYRQLAKAIDRLSWWIANEIGTSNIFSTISYLGEASILNFMLIVSAVKTGHQLLLMNPSQPVETSRIILEETKCTRVLVDDKPTYPVAALRELGYSLMTLPDLDHWLQDQASVEPYVYTKTFQQARSDPFVALTTSGSTNAPKAIVVRHGTIAHHDLLSTEALPNGPLTALGQLDGQRVLLGMALNHGAGINFITYAVYSTMIPVIGPPMLGSMPVEIVHAGILRGIVSASLVTPWVVMELTESPERLEAVRKLRYLTYGGLSIPSSTGDLLATHTHLFTLFGITETGFYTLEATEREDWQWLHMSPMMGAAFRKIGTDAFQMVFERGKGPHQGAFHTFPELQEYDTKDIYAKHPSKPGLYLHQGRADLLIRLNHSEWINPLPYEADIDQDPRVVGSLLYGTGQDVPSLLIEAKNPPNDAETQKALLERLWATIEGANKRLSELRVPVPRELVIFTKTSQPMLRSTKGSVQRKASLDLYKQLLEDSYTAHIAPE